MRPWHYSARSILPAWDRPRTHRWPIPRDVSPDLNYAAAAIEGSVAGHRRLVRVSRALLNGQRRVEGSVGGGLERNYNRATRAGGQRGAAVVRLGVHGAAAERQSGNAGRHFICVRYGHGLAGVVANRVVIEADRPWRNRERRGRGGRGPRPAEPGGKCAARKIEGQRAGLDARRRRPEGNLDRALSIRFDSSRAR